VQWARTALTAALLGLVSTASADPVDDYVRSQLQSRRLPGVSLAVVKDGRIVKAAGYGLASLELDAPATEKTVYEIGSISKQFAANAVLLLVEDGKVRLDDPVSKYLTNSPAAWSAITVRHILTHTAGLADFDTGNIGFSYRREYTPEEFVELLGRQPLGFQPGERWNYTNGFPLLGMVIERASGMPYTEFVRSRIFAPLGMDSARFKTASDVVPQRADGYLYKDGAYRHGENLRPAIIAPNGGIMMNVVDFAKWDIAITQGRLLRAESLKAMMTPVRLNDGRTVSHGLGWFMDSFNGHRFGAHWGTTVAGYSAVIRRYVDDRVTVIMLANLDDGGLSIDTMSKRIADSFVPGVDVHGLSPKTDPVPAETVRLKEILAMVGAGREDERAPGLATRLPQPVRDRIAATMRTATAFEFLGADAVGDEHFNLDPALRTIKWYRVRTADGMRYFTLRLSADGRLLGAILED
jgi:CubicO group peptidase (beta-lactamase class C family)